MPANNTYDLQEVTDQQDKMKVQFMYDKKNVHINALTDLKFSVLNSTTNEYIKNFLARVVVIEGPEMFGFNDIRITDGKFDVKHAFTSYGSHQVILRVDTNSSIMSIPFEVIIPEQLPSSSQIAMKGDKSLVENSKQYDNFTNYIIIIIGVAVSIIMTAVLGIILRKK